MLPENYWLPLAAGTVLPFVTNIVLGGPVMRARKQFDVPYPNLYATPGHHKHADAFNRVQRGHQSMLETMPNVMACTLVGGLKHPQLAAAAGLLYCVGSYLFLIGYADVRLDAKVARYQKGGPLKPLGYLLALGTACSALWSMATR